MSFKIPVTLYIITIKTSGLANLSSYDTAKGIIMHTALAVSIEGLVLGILDQKVYSRPEETENLKKERSH